MNGHLRGIRCEDCCGKQLGYWGSCSAFFKTRKGVLWLEVHGFFFLIRVRRSGQSVSYLCVKVTPAAWKALRAPHCCLSPGDVTEALEMVQRGRAVC